MGDLRIILKAIDEFNQKSKEELHAEMNELIQPGDIPVLSENLNIIPDTLRSYVKVSKYNRPSFENYIKIKDYSQTYLQKKREESARKKLEAELSRKAMKDRQIEIYEKRKEGYTCQEVADMFNVSKSYVSTISKRFADKLI